MNEAYTKAVMYIACGYTIDEAVSIAELDGLDEYQLEDLEARLRKHFTE